MNLSTRCKKCSEEQLCIDCSAHTLGVAPRTLRSWLDRRVISYHKMEGSIRIPAAVLTSYKRKTLIPQNTPLPVAI